LLSSLRNFTSNPTSNLVIIIIITHATAVLAELLITVSIDMPNNEQARSIDRDQTTGPRRVCVCVLLMLGDILV